MGENSKCINSITLKKEKEKPLKSSFKLVKVNMGTRALKYPRDFSPDPLCEGLAKPSCEGADRRYLRLLGSGSVSVSTTLCCCCGTKMVTEHIRALIQLCLWALRLGFHISSHTVLFFYGFPSFSM